MRIKLTSRLIKALSPDNKPYEVLDTELRGFLLRIQPSGHKSYYLSYRNSAGKRCRYRIAGLDQLTLMQAREIAQQLLARIIQGEDIQAAKKTNKIKQQMTQKNTLSAFVEQYYQSWVTSNHRHPQRTLRRLSHSFGFLYPCPLNDINRLSIEAWQQDCLKKGKKASSINRDLVALKSLLSKAAEWGQLKEHPLKNFKQLSIDRKPRVRFLSVEEETRLRRFLLQRDQTERAMHSKDRFKDFLTPLVLLAINTGLRRGELLNLKWEDIDFSKRLLTVEGATAKTGQTRHVPLNKEAHQVLQDWLKQQAPLHEDIPWVFLNRHEEKLHQIDYFWKLILRSASIEKCRFHDLRHHFASKLVMAGVDLNVVRELLGHASIEMTLRYAHLAPEHKAKAVEKLCSLAVVL